jgi:hypothetical protein
VTPRVALEYAAADDLAGTVVGAVEILDSGLRTLATAPVRAAEPSYVELSGPGRYAARGRLAGGTWIGASFEVSPDATEPVLSVRLEPSRAGAEQSGPPDQDRLCWTVGYERAGATWRVFDSFGSDRTRRDRVDLTPGALWGPLTAVQVGGEGLASRFVIVPNGAGLRLSRAGRSVRAELPPGLARTLLTFLRDGDLVCARIVAEPVLADRRPGTGQSLLDLAIGYYLVAAGGDLAPDWAERLVQENPESPDALVLSAWAMLRVRPDYGGDFRSRLLRAAELGPPAVGAGLGLLRDGLYLVAGSGSGEDREAQAASLLIRRFSTARLPGVLTSYHGVDPASPAVQPPEVPAPIPALATVHLLSSVPASAAVETTPPPQPRQTVAEVVRGIRTAAEGFFAARLSVVGYFADPGSEQRPLAATLELPADVRRLLGPDVTGSVSLHRGMLRVTLARLGAQAADATVFVTIAGADLPEVEMRRRTDTFAAALPWAGDLPDQLDFRVDDDAR